MTWDGNYIYRGKSTYFGDILYTYDRQYLYKGKSSYFGDIILTIDGHIPIGVLMTLVY